MSEKQSDLFLFDSLGMITLGVDKKSHEIVLILRTPVGAVHAAITSDRATQLGCSLIRAAGQRWDFSAELAAQKESSDEVPPDRSGVRRAGAIPGGLVTPGNGGPRRIAGGEGAGEGIVGDPGSEGAGQPAD